MYPVLLAKTTLVITRLHGVMAVPNKPLQFEYFNYNKVPGSKITVPVEPLQSEYLSDDEVLETSSEHNSFTFNTDLGESRRPRTPEPPQTEYCRHRPCPLVDHTTLDDQNIILFPIVILAQQKCANNNSHQDTNDFYAHGEADRPNTDKRDVHPAILEAQSEDDRSNTKTQKDPGNGPSRVPPGQLTFGPSRDAVQQKYSASRNTMNVSPANMVGNDNRQDPVQDNATRTQSTQEGIPRHFAANENTLTVAPLGMYGNGNVQTVHQYNILSIAVNYVPGHYTEHRNTHDIHGDQNNMGHHTP